MREIKCCGKRVDNGEWVIGAYSTDYPYTKRHMIITHDIYDKYGGLRYYTVDPTTVGQYTGLHDKTGAEIYEGDIVLYRYYFSQHESEVIKLKIVWFVDGFIGELENGYRRSLPVHNSIEIVDNIYDNPKLLQNF